MPNRVPARPCTATPPSIPPCARAVLLFVLAAALAVLAGCSDRPRLNALDNQSPEVSLEPIRHPDKAPDGALHLVEWRGHDADGRIDHYRIAINPRTLDDDDPAWTATGERRRSVFAARRARIGAAGRERMEDGAIASDRDFDLIAVQAVDDRGAVSLPAVRAFFEDNVAPTVRITSPMPRASSLDEPIVVPPSPTIRFDGTDPDGATGEPSRYEYLLLSSYSDDPFPLTVAVLNPDSIRRFYAPEFEGWTEVAHRPGEGGEVTLGLLPDRRYVFVVVAFDSDGAYSPVFDFETNMLFLRVPSPGEFSPRMSLITNVWSAPLHGAGLPGPTVVIEHPADLPIELRWTATPASGDGAIEYRWVLDSEELDKEFKRPRAGNDLHHWRPWSPTLTSAVIGPFPGGETHEFVVEARDRTGERSRLTLRLHSVTRAYDGDLLIVDDTRLWPDEAAAGTGCVRPPTGPWPTAAELDTFLFARGNTPWRCYPAGTMSSPGLFVGYDFDTLGTLVESSDLTVPLEVLRRYRHVVWIVDTNDLDFPRPPWNPGDPITALGYMSMPGHVNTLAEYIRGGGQVWLLGGRAGSATMALFNSPNNNGGGLTFSNALNELVPGRFMYDFVHWRSEFKVATVGALVNRDLGRSPSWPGAPDYNRLPMQMRNRTAANSPVPPLRTPTTYYRATVDVEFLSQQNFIIEGGVSVLDSLYRVDSFQLPVSPAKRVCMTYYHGIENPPVMFSGFDIWSFARADCQALVDFVLQETWGLTRSAPAVAPVADAAGR